MIAIAWYLAKVIICSAILMGYYWLALRNKAFHHYNRFYLLVTVMLSILLPFVQISFWHTNAEPNNVIKVIEAVSYGNTYVNDFVINSSPIQKTFNWQTLYPIFYILISVVLSIGFIKMLFQIRTLLKKYPTQKIDEVTFVNTNNEKGTPFSFLQYIFWNNQINTSTPQGNQIFKHELAHIKEKHTYDKLFINIVLILFWYNPFFWLLRKELNLIHEFIADKKAVENGDTSAFAAMLLQTIYPQHQFSIANNFFYSPIKRRLIMLSKIKNTKINYFGRILVLPLAVLVLAAFTFKVNKQQLHLYSGKKVTVVIDAGHGGEKDPGAKSSSGITEKEITLTLAKLIKNYNTNYDIEIDLIREDDVYLSPIEKAKIANDKKADLFISLHVDGAPLPSKKTGMSFYVAKDEYANSAKSKVFASSILNEFATNYQLPVLPNPLQRQAGIWVLQNVNAPSVLIEVGFITNDKDVAYLQSKEGKEAIAKNILAGIEKYLSQLQVSIADTIPKNLPTEAQWEKAAENNFQTKPSVTITSLNGKVDFYGDKKNTINVEDNSLYVVNGVITSKIDMEKLSPNAITKIDILKGESATKIYGEKGKNGVVVITTKSNIPPATKPHIAIGLDKMNVLYIGLENPITIAVNGYNTNDLIVSMKNGSIEGKNGKYIAKVSNTNSAEIIIETIENGERKLLGTQTYRVRHMPDPVNGKNVSDFDIQVPPKFGIDEVKKTTVPDMLYMVNGLQSTKQEVAKIISEDIIDVRVLNAKDAMPTYGEKASNGVMIFNVKQKNKLYVETFDLDADAKNVGKNAYIELDGKPFKDEFNTIPKQILKSIKIIGKNKAVELYGEKAKEGAIIVTTN